MERPIVVLVGTRPEALKLLLLHKKLQAEGFPSLLCSTEQHSDILNQVFKTFDILPDISLGIMKPNQDLFDITSSILIKLREVLVTLNPRLLIVQGDTSSAFAAALSAFYLKIPIAHVEAGLRSGNMNAPYPEELNRIIISKIADYNFAPTALSCANLLNDGVAREKIFCTGNTIVDSLFWIKNKISSGQIAVDGNLVKKVEKCKKLNQKIAVLTAHRRESFGGGLLKIFSTIKKFALNHKDLFIFYTLHPNPNVIAEFEKSGLGELENIFVSNPLGYTELVYLLINSSFVITDSGGIQEEAMSLGKRVIILRDVTERIEGLWEGLGKLVGVNEFLIYEGLEAFYSKDCQDRTSTIFGDGNAVNQICNILKIKLYMAEKKSGKVVMDMGV
ncbi:MAG: UDP-N-acetylglucosamine 2-epimerase (non-hydrolyzing) [Candidatus Babeliales bacterium]|jgi:UDP-N-acetylglucosamine 2-epimerase (non-hydrolysing)